MTFWWSEDNYGQILQCYALQKYLNDLGNEAFLIKYRNTPPPLFTKFYKIFNPVKLYGYIVYRIKRKKILEEQKNNNRGFADFRKRYISISDSFYQSFDELKKNPPEADAYIVGSDQVWNPNLSSNQGSALRAYFLDFGNDKTKRISYAASFGQEFLKKDIQKTIKPLLQKFSYVSVREVNGVDLCKKCGCNIAEWVPDPTMLLTADDYRKIYLENEIRKPNGRYLLLYMLDNECDFDIEKVYDFAQRKNIKVVYVTGNSVYDSREKFFATIPEWLYLLDNAEYIVTNSFHCGAFSTIFHKQFGIVALSGKYAGMNSRFDSLFELRGMGSRYITNGNFSILDEEYEDKVVKVPHNFIKIFIG